MSRSKSSQRWLQEHRRDIYVQQARKEGYRSRAAFKLLEIQKKDRIIRPGMCVVELGAAPGGWTTLLAEWVGDTGQVFALDLLPMQAVPKVTFWQADFTDPQVVAHLLEHLKGRPIDVILSDMAPNFSGIGVSDQLRTVGLVEEALEFAKSALRQNGCFLAKLFQGMGVDALVKDLKQNFKQVHVRKPEASKAKSAEIYLLAKGYKKSDWPKMGVHATK